MSEVLRDLVVSLSLDGDNFSRNLTSINKQIQEAESEFKRAASGVENFEKSVSGTQSQLSSLQQKLALQQKAVKQYERALEAANKKLENAYNRQGKLTESLDAAKQKNADLKQQVAAATKQYERFSRELGESDSATLAAKANLDALSQEYAESSAEVKKLEGQLAANTKSLQNNADAVTKARTNLNNAQGALRQTEQQIRTTTERLARMQSAWTKAGDTLTAFGKKCASVSASMEKLGKGMTTALTTPVLALGTAAIKASVEYESAFTSVRKTVDATEAEYEQLSDAVKKMSTEVATDAADIAEVMANAGQLGIQNDYLVEFTRTMIDLGNSTDIAADEAATAIAQFANITKMSQADFGRFGSALVDLGNNYATTESAIMDMATRLAAAGSQVGLTQAQILGFATALSSVGLEAQAGGTAFSKAMIEIQVAVETNGKSLKDFARVAGLTTEEFKALWNSDPAGAIEKFIVGLSQMDEQGVSSIVTLQEMGFTEVRLRDTLMRATNATELFSEAQQTATSAWEDNVALSNEAGNHVDKLLNYIRFWQASGESEKTSIRIREKQTQMTIAGEYHGGMVPFGFDAICTGRVNKKGQPVKDLVRNEAEAAIKAELYHKVVDEGYGLHRLANWLNEQGIKTKRGTTLWRNTSVRAMIGNPIDRGQMHSGDVLSEPFEHLRIIDDYYFYKAVEIIRGRASTKREGPLRTDSGGLLTGMIYCGECGERLTINHCQKVTDTQEGQREYRWSVYRCYRKINSRKTCTGQSTYNTKRIDEAVLSIVRSFFARITTLPEAAQMQAAMQRENLIQEKAIQTAEDNVEKATKALSALEDEALKTLSGESKLTLDTISKLIEKQKAKQTDARMKLQALLEEKQTDDEKFKAKQEQLQRTKEWAQILDIATPPRKQMILAEIIDRVEVRCGHEITVKFKLTAQQFLDPNGCETISKIAS